MRVVKAHPDDIPAWLALAAEVEPHFGPMVSDPGYRNALQKNIERGTAFCIREQNGPPKTPLMGGLLLSPRPPKVEIAWLAVAARWRRRGVGRALVAHALDGIAPPAEVVLITFASHEAAAAPARGFYESFGFVPAEPGPVNPGGIATQVYRRVLGETPTVRAVVQRGSDSNGNEVLLVQHHYADPANAGKWSLPGGRIDAQDVHREDTLRRELYEELRMSIVMGRSLGMYAHNHRLHYVYLATARSTTPRPDSNEIAALRWCTMDEVEQLQREGQLFAPFIYEAIQKANAPKLLLL